MKHKILIIENDRDTAEMLGFVANSLGYEYVIYNDIIPIKDIEWHSPKLIILDHKLNTGLGGLLARKIKTTPSTKTICVILMSAHNDIEKIAKESLADAYIAKPFDINRLEKEIKECLENY